MKLRLQTGQTRGADAFDSLNLIAFGALLQMVEIAVLLGTGCDNQLAALTIGDAAFVAIAIQRAPPAHAKPSLEAFGLVVDP